LRGESTVTRRHRAWMVTAMTCHGRARDRCFLVLYCRGSWVVGRRDGNVKGMRHVRLILFLLVMPVSSSSSWSCPPHPLPPGHARLILFLLVMPVSSSSSWSCPSHPLPPGHPRPHHCPLPVRWIVPCTLRMTMQRSQSRAVRHASAGGQGEGHVARWFRGRQCLGG